LEGGGIEEGKEDSCKEAAALNIHIVGQREREEGRGRETHSGFDIKKQNMEQNMREQQSLQ